MPQMAPLMWLSLFFIFLSIYLLFNVMNYSSFLSSSNKLNNYKNLLNKSSLIWKW